MHSLVTDEDNTIDDKEKIVAGMEQFYGALCKISRDSEEKKEAKRELLKYTTMQVTPQQMEEIEKDPIAEELQKIL